MKISVLIPCWNRAAFVRAALDSVLVQTHTDWEIVVVDDGSTDESRKVVQEYMSAHLDREIVLIAQGHGGCAGATKTAIQYATTSLCTVLDADDMLLPHSLDTISRAFEGRLHIGFLWTRWRHTGSLKCWSKDLPKGKTLKEALLAGWWGAQCQRAFRREVYENTPGLDPAIPLAVDMQLAALFAESGCGVLSIPEVTYVYRDHRGQSSKTMSVVQRQSASTILKGLKDGRFKRGYVHV